MQSPRIVSSPRPWMTSAAASLDIGVEKDNPRARRLYERLGCVQVAEDEEEYKLRWCP
jgi:RimJ/RimL family protein N-acetyltransferase